MTQTTHTFSLDSPEGQLLASSLKSIIAHARETGSTPPETAEQLRDGVNAVSDLYGQFPELGLAGMQFLLAVLLYDARNSTETLEQVRQMYRQSQRAAA